MNRQELLTKLAMELEGWPRPDNMPCPPILGTWTNHGAWRCYASGDMRCINRADWIAERERLVNKPSWVDAPEWAQWLAQDSTGEYCWHQSEPKAHDRQWDSPGQVKNSNIGALPAGHNWRETLEQRPDAKPEAPEWDGGLPPVGAECDLSMSGNQGEKVVITYRGDGVFCYRKASNLKEYTGATRDAQFRPIRSEEDIAVEHMKSVAGISYVTPEAMDMITRALYRAGYRKAQP